MKQGVPTITAPLSRTKRKPFPTGIVCAVTSVIFAFGGTIIIAMAMTSTSSDGNDSTNDISRENKRKLRQPVRVQEERNNHPSQHHHHNAQGLIIRTHMGDIHIHFTPALAGNSSIEYIADVVQAASAKRNNGMGSETMNGRRITEGFTCQRCNFYRAEKQLLLQGVIAHNPIPKNNLLGPCPVENYVPKTKCPEHDPNCGCHGPIMTKGMVGWAGGSGGPDFFINTFAKPVDWWENQHTIWGEIRDDKSMEVVENTYDLKAHMSSMRMLDEKIEFSLELF